MANFEVSVIHWKHCLQRGFEYQLNFFFLRQSNITENLISRYYVS